MSSTLANVGRFSYKYWFVSDFFDIKYVFNIYLKLKLRFFDYVRFWIVKFVIDVVKIVINTIFIDYNFYI
jgi:hypothetical protein